MAAVPPPTAEAQLVFLTKLQRLFAEGAFTATYKFALLVALSELAVELGSDDGRELSLTTRRIGERFIHLYWQQTSPYGTGRVDASPGILVQNIGAQAAVVAAIAAFRSQVSVSTPQQAARLGTPYQALLTRVTQTVSAQPLTYLQNFGGVTDQFLYERPRDGVVLLKPGIAYCLRRFHTLVQQLARFHWVGHIKANRQNLNVLGEASDLEDFLFSTSRQSLLLMGEGLRKIDGGRCFYCQQSLQSADVDHYMPFSLYPRDLAHNFVLAHPGCNRSKSDTLAARPHLERWLERTGKSGDMLAEVGIAAGIVADVGTSRRVAEWGYANAHACGGHAWVTPAAYEAVDERYLTLFGLFAPACA